mgnify:CR=1 FL=1
MDLPVYGPHKVSYESSINVVREWRDIYWTVEGGAALRQGRVRLAGRQVLRGQLE